jgi:hypothetical protein
MEKPVKCASPLRWMSLVVLVISDVQNLQFLWNVCLNS